MSTAATIDLRGLSKRFGTVQAVDDVSFSVEPGEIFGLMGHNGAGKTTTLRMLLGLTHPTAGSATVLGYDVIRDTLDVRRVSGYLPGSYALPPEMSARRRFCSTIWCSRYFRIASSNSWSADWSESPAFCSSIQTSDFPPPAASLATIPVPQANGCWEQKKSPWRAPRGWKVGMVEETTSRRCSTRRSECVSY
jgi:energy-coupling factor transporter ATP-binding protein EcfA2